MRSESEKSFDECQMRRARLQSFGLAYLTPQNKSLARSFRYMRHKPTIIAFKTPSLENYEARINAVANQVNHQFNCKNLILLVFTYLVIRFVFLELFRYQIQNVLLRKDV